MKIEAKEIELLEKEHPQNVVMADLVADEVKREYGPGFDRDFVGQEKVTGPPGKADVFGVIRKDDLVVAHEDSLLDCFPLGRTRFFFFAFFLGLGG